MKPDISYWCCGKNIHSKVLLMAHLEMVHGIDCKTQVFQERMRQHVDGKNWYSTTYDLSCDKVTFSKVVKCLRDKDDLLYFECEEEK